MAENAGYNSELAQEFERLWQQVVLQKTTDAARAAIQTALTGIVGKMDLIEQQTERRLSRLDQRIAALSEIDDRIAAILERSELEWEKFDQANAKASLLGDSIDRAINSLNELNDAEAKITKIGKFITALDSEAQRAALRTKIAEIIDSGRVDEVNPEEILQKVSEIANLPPSPVGGAAKRNLSRWYALRHWLKGAGQTNRGLQFWLVPLILISVVTLVLVWQTKPYGLFEKNAPPQSRRESQRVDVAVEDGWRRLKSLADGDFSAFCTSVSCDRFDEVWNQPEFDADPPRRLALLAKIVVAEGYVSTPDSTDCETFEGRISTNEQLNSWSTTRLAQAGLCLQEQAASQPSDKQLEIARWIAEAYLAKVPKPSTESQPTSAMTSRAATPTTSTSKATAPATASAKATGSTGISRGATGAQPSPGSEAVP